MAIWQFEITEYNTTHIHFHGDAHWHLEQNTSQNTNTLPTEQQLFSIKLNTISSIPKMAILGKQPFAGINFIFCKIWIGTVSFVLVSVLPEKKQLSNG